MHEPDQLEAKRLISEAIRRMLARPRGEIDWHPYVDAKRCTGCGECYSFCPHCVYEMRGGIAAIANPTECVILCSNCMPRCSAQAISFPPQKGYAEFLRHE